jgi:dTDP-glucose pyrophosphorylase
MAGGLGTRMKSGTPKHLHPLLGRRMVDWVLASAEPLGAEPVVVVCSPQTEDAMRASLDGGVTLAVQAEARGTGDAVASARGALATFEGDVLVLSGDTPMLRAELLEDLVATHRREGAAATILAIEPDGPRPYGRIVRNDDGSVSGIVEELDATQEQRAIRELNSSIYVFRARDLWSAVERLDPQNAQGELYLTDTIGHLVRDGLRVAVHRAPDPTDAEGVNTRVELAATARVLRDRINEAHMLAGVAIVDPESTWIDPAVTLEPDAVVHPFTSPPAPRWGPTRSSWTRMSGNGPSWGRSVTFAPERSWRRAPRPARSWRSRTRRSGKGPRCPTCRTSATPRSAPGRTSEQGRSQRTSRISPAVRRAGRGSAATSASASTIPSWRRSRSGTTPGSPPAR